MQIVRRKRRFPATFILIGALFLAACTSTGGTEPVAEAGVVAVATATPLPIVENEAEASAETEATTATEGAGEASVTEEAEPASVDAADLLAETEGQIVIEDGTVISTVDDRNDRFVSLTQGWNTNWEIHTINYDDILSGGPPRDGIPSIDAPSFVSQDEARDWLAGNEPVIAVEIDGVARAYPLQILTWHEIVNDTLADVPVLVTFCPLCNSAIVFERLVDGEAVEFGTSGLLHNSDLIMYDRKTESLWQQFTGEAIAGDQVPNRLTFLASSLISFDDFSAAYPDGDVLSRDTGINRPYGQNPYAGYDTVGSNPFLFTGDLDARLPAVERVVTVSLADEGLDIAYPLSILSEVGVINDTQGGRDLVVFHANGTSSALGAAAIAEAEDVGATGVFNPVVNGELLTFVRADNKFVDNETGTTWNIVGQALEGPLVGSQLEPVVSGDHFWFSWAAFKPDTIIYQN